MKREVCAAHEGASMPLCRALDNCGLSAVASHLTALQPHGFDTKPLTHVRHAERHLRAWQRDERDRPYLEHAIARLVLCALALSLAGGGSNS